MSAVAVVGRACGLERSGGQERDRTHLRGGVGPEDANVDQEATVIRILHELDMPPEEIQALVAAGDPVVVHRYIELHAERLAERLADQLQALVGVERTLTNTTLGHGPASRGPLPRPEMASRAPDATRTRERTTPDVPHSHVPRPMGSQWTRGRSAGGGGWPAARR